MKTQIDIKKLRDKLGWSQNDMATYLGVDRSTVSRIENGHHYSGPIYRLLSILEKSNRPSNNKRAA